MSKDSNLVPLSLLRTVEASRHQHTTVPQILWAFGAFSCVREHSGSLSTYKNGSRRYAREPLDHLERIELHWNTSEIALDPE